MWGVEGTLALWPYVAAAINTVLALVASGHAVLSNLPLAFAMASRRMTTSDKPRTGMRRRRLTT